MANEKPIEYKMLLSFETNTCAICEVSGLEEYDRASRDALMKPGIVILISIDTKRYFAKVCLVHFPELKPYL